MADFRFKRNHVRGIRCVICDSPVVKNIQLFPFPSQLPLRQAWIQFASQFSDEVNPKSSQICSQHFDQGSWMLVKKKVGEFGIGTSSVLKPGAIPTVIKIENAQGTKRILESKNSLLSMIMAPKLELAKNTPTRDISQKALHASIKSVERIFEACTVCGSSKRGSTILHKLPDSILLKMKWLDFIEHTTKKRTQIPLGRVRVCSQHFDDSCYDLQQSIMNSTGYGVKIKKVMKKTAIPSIFWVRKNGEPQVVILRDDETQNDEHESEASNSVKVKIEPEDNDVECLSPLPQTDSRLIRSARTNLEQLLNKSVQKFIRPKSEKEMYKLLSKCEKEEIQKIKSIRGGDDEKPNLFACKCGEGFLSKALLNEHQKVHLSAECVYHCSICKAKFHSHRTYDQHLISHFGLNRRLCAVCGQSLASKIDFQKHIQIVHGGKCVNESPHKLSSLLKKHGKGRYDDWEPEEVTSGSEFEIEIDFDNPEPGETLLPLTQSEASTSGTSQNDCLGIIDKIANRLKDFKPSACQPELEKYSDNEIDVDEQDLVEITPTQKKSTVKSKNRPVDGASGIKDNLSSSQSASDASTIAGSQSLPRIKCTCTLIPFTDPRCFHGGSNVETKNCLAIRIPKIDDVITHLKTSSAVTLSNSSESSQDPPPSPIPDSTGLDIPQYHKKKKTKRKNPFGTRKRRKRNNVLCDIKQEVFEYKVVPILGLNEMEQTRESNLSLTEEGFGDPLLTIKSENIKIEKDTDEENGEDWSVMMNTDYDVDEPMIDEDELTLSAEELTLSEKESTLSEKESTLSEKESTLSEKESMLSEKAPTISEEEPMLFEEEPMVDEGVDPSVSHLTNDSEDEQDLEFDEDYPSEQNQLYLDDLDPDTTDSRPPGTDFDRQSDDGAASSQGDSGIVLISRSITEDEFKSHDSVANSSDSLSRSSGLNSKLSITNMITSIDHTSIKIEPFHSHTQDQNLQDESEDDVDDMETNPQSSTQEIKQEPSDTEIESSTETYEVSENVLEETAVTLELTDCTTEEPRVFFSQTELDSKDPASSIQDQIVSSESVPPHSEKSFQFQKVNLYDGNVDLAVVDDHTKPIVDDLLQKLNNKKEKEARITLEYFPSKPAGPTEYACAECYEGFHHKVMLEEHLKNHKKEKPFLCWICFSQFQEYTTYTGHLTQHVGKNTKMCFMCGFRTSTSRTLTNHFNAQHKIEESKPKTASSSVKPSNNPPSSPTATEVLVQLPEAKKRPVRRAPIDTKFICELCQLICVDSEHLKLHLTSECNVVKGALRPQIRK